MEIQIISKGKWHPSILLKSSKGTICRLQEHPGGCGTMLMSQWSHLDNSSCAILEEDIVEALQHLQLTIKNLTVFSCEQQYKHKIDVGSITTILGKRFYNGKFEKSLLKVGFKEVSCYPNPRHSMDYTQKLYIWTISDIKKNNKLANGETLLKVQ